MIKFSHKLHGFEEIKKELTALPKKIEARIIRKALQDAAKIIEAEVRKNLTAVIQKNDDGTQKYVSGTSTTSKKYGSIFKNLKVKPARKRGNEIGFDITCGDSFWARFIEYGFMHKGHKAEYTDLKGLKHKTRSGQDEHFQVEARPFMRPAFFAKRKEALNLVSERLIEYAEKEFKKIKKAA